MTADVAAPDTWTGVEVRALRHALRLDERAFGVQVGVSRRQVIRWENAGADGTPAQAYQYALDRLLSIAADDVRVRYRNLTAGPHRRVIRARDGAAVVVEPTGRDEVEVVVYPHGLDQYVGESFTLSWRKAGALAIALLNAAEQR